MRCQADVAVGFAVGFLGHGWKGDGLENEPIISGYKNRWLCKMLRRGINRDTCSGVM